MRSHLWIGICMFSVVGLAAAGVRASTDVLRYTGIEVHEGAIDGIDLAGQIATVEIEFASGLVASDETYKLGSLISARYEFSDAGLYVVDNPQDTLEFGNVNDFDLSFFDSTLDLRMLSGATAGDQPGFDPLDGETLGEFFRRWGDGHTIDFTSSTNFQMLNISIGGLNGGASFVTMDIVGLGQSDVTLTYVPAPSTGVLLCAGLYVLGRRRRDR